MHELRVRLTPVYDNKGEKDVFDIEAYICVGWVLLLQGTVLEFGSIVGDITVPWRCDAGALSCFYFFWIFFLYQWLVVDLYYTA